MEIQRIDHVYISEPLSLEQRLGLLKELQHAAFLEGVDKGTLLERDTRQRLEIIKARRRQKRFYDLIELVNDQIQLGIKRNKRKKYKGRYPKNGKKNGNAHKEITAIPIVNYKHPSLPAWFQ